MSGKNYSQPLVVCLVKSLSLRPLQWRQVNRPLSQKDCVPQPLASLLGSVWKLVKNSLSICYGSVGPASINSTKPPEASDLEASHGCSPRNQSTNGGYKHWQMRARQRESAKMTSTGCSPREHLGMSIGVCQTRSLPLRLNLQDKLIGLSHREMEAIFQYAAAPCRQTKCHPTCHSPMEPQTQALLATKARPYRNVLWVAATKSIMLNINTRKADTCTNFHPGITSALECRWEYVESTCLARSPERITVSP